MFNKFLVTYILLFSINGNAQNRHLFSQDSLWGYKDSMGIIRISPLYQKAEPFRNNYAIVLFQNAFGLIDTNGHWQLQPKYDYLRIGDSTFFIFGFKSKFFGEYTVGAWSSLKREVILPSNFRTIEKKGRILELTQRFDEDSHLNRQTRYGAADLNGVIIIPCSFDMLRIVSDLLLVLSKEGKQALFGVNGKQMTPFVYTVIDFPSEGLLKVRIGEKYGFLTCTGKLAIPLEFEFCESFVAGASLARKGSYWGAINKKGKWIVNPKYTYAEVKNKLQMSSD